MKRDRHRHRNRKHEAGVQAGPVLAGLLICGLLGFAAIGYLRLKQQISELAKDRLAAEQTLADLRETRVALRHQLDKFRSPGWLEKRVEELGLDLAAPEPHQILILEEPIPGIALPRKPHVTPPYPVEAREEQYARHHLAGERR